MEVPITSLTLVTVVVVLYGAINRRGYGRALSLGAATPVGAAAGVGPVAVPTFYAVAIGAAIAVAASHLRRAPDHGASAWLPVPASRTLVLLVVTSVLITLVAPLIFNGLPVLSGTGAASHLVAGVIGKSNIAQMIYLVLSVSVVAYLARSRWTGPGVVGTAACLATVLSFWAWTHTSAGIPYPEGLFDNSPGFMFQNTLPGGAPRVRGIFSEPAGLATSCLVTMSYCASRVRQVSGLRKLGLLAVGGTALYLGSISTSTTFVVAGSMLLAIAMVTAVSSFVLRGGSLSAGATAVLCAAAIASVWFLPYIANSIGQQISDKVGSSSYQDRSFADSSSYSLVFQTYGLGSGLGSNRASSFAASLLSTVGIAGAALLTVAIVVLIRRSWPAREVRPVAWALAAILMAKLVSGPDLNDTTGILWMSLGVLASAALRRSQSLSVAPSTPGSAPTTAQRRYGSFIPRTGWDHPQGTAFPCTSLGLGPISVLAAPGASWRAYLFAPLKYGVRSA